jgi:hypothetical protein
MNHMLDMTGAAQLTLEDLQEMNYLLDRAILAQTQFCDGMTSVQAFARSLVCGRYDVGSVEYGKMINYSDDDMIEFSKELAKMGRTCEFVNTATGGCRFYIENKKERSE